MRSAVQDGDFVIKEIKKYLGVVNENMDNLNRFRNEVFAAAAKIFANQKK